MSHVHGILDGVCQGQSFQSFVHELRVEPLHFPVEAVAYLFQHDVRVGVPPGVLPLCHYALEDFVHVGQVEVSAECEVLGSPVVASQEWVYVVESATSRGGVA